MGWTHSYSFSDTGSLVRADRGLLMRSPLFLAAAAVLFGVALDAGAANATCKRFGFTVNDYGKEGPTKDAKDLLDKHIAEWAAEQKIKDYKTGKKDVNCELFLNFVVFDEHTCTASANVCWNDGKGSSTPDAGVARRSRGRHPADAHPQGFADGPRQEDRRRRQGPACRRRDAARLASGRHRRRHPARRCSTGGSRAYLAASGSRADQGRRNDASAGEPTARDRRDGHPPEGSALGAQETRGRRAGCGAGAGEERGRGS